MPDGKKLTARFFLLKVRRSFSRRCGTLGVSARVPKAKASGYSLIFLREISLSDRWCCSGTLFLQQAFLFALLCLLLRPDFVMAQTEPPHPILTISGSGSGASTILSTWTEAQYTNNFIPHQPPRNDGYGFAPPVVSGDTAFSWSSSNPNQITSTPSGIVFPNGTYTSFTQAVTVFSGNTVLAPYYLKAGSSSSKSLVFALIDYHKLSQLRSDFNKLAPAYINSGSSPTTRNDAYARRIAIALLDWARWYPDYYLTGKNSASFINTSPSYILASDLQRASDHNGLAHEWQDDELLAFDAIYDSVALTNLSSELGFDVRNYIKTNLFCNEGDFIENHVPVDVAIQSNLSGPYTVLAEVARVLNRPDYIIWMDQYLDATVRQKIRRDGVLEEGLGYSIGYINENLNGAKGTRDYFLTRAADTPTLQAISNRVGSYVSTLTYGQSQWNAASLPTGQLPTFGDTPFNNYFSSHTAGNSALLPAYGHVAMGAGSGSQAVQVNQNFPGDNNHMRSDVTAFVLWAFNNEMLGNIRYYNGTPGRQFDEQILAHNAITIDRVNMTPYPDADTYGNGDLTLYEPGNNGLAMTEIDGQRAYSSKASRYQRLLLLNSADLSRPYLVDIFRVTGGTNHDYTLHGAIRWDQTGQCSFPLVTNPAPYPMLEGETWVEPTSSGSSFPYYGFWRNVSSNQAPGNFQITYRDTNRVSGRDVRLWMTDDGTAKVYLGMTPNPGRDNTVPANFYVYWRPSTIIRKRIPSGTLQDLFVSVVEPMNAGNGTVQSVERLPLTGSNLESVALKITFTDGRVDTYLVNLRNLQVNGATAGSATVSTADGQYSLTGRVGVHMDRASGDSRVWTINATDFQFPGRRLSTPGTYYSGLISGETRKLTGGTYDAFTTSTALPTGTGMRNKFLSLTHGTLSGSGTTGVSEMFKIDQVVLSNSQYYVCFTNDHMLEITNGTTSVEQMAPLRTFTGSNSFEIALTAFAGQFSVIPNVSIPPGGSRGPINFSFGNLGTTAGSALQLVAISANQTLVPNSNLVLGGSGTSRTITVTPVAGVTGSSLITLLVTDGTWTNSRSFTAFVSDLSLSASPASQTVLPGMTTNFTLTVTATNGFSGTVSFGISGLPPQSSAGFSPPTLTGAGSVTVNVFTSNAISPGGYPLTLTATSGGLSSTSSVTLLVNSIVAVPGTMLWTGSNNWSSLANWTNLSASGFGPPGVSNDVVFGDVATVASTNTFNNIVDSDITINSLVITNTSGFHNTFVNPGRTLSIIGSAPGFANSPALNVGLEGYTGLPNQLVRGEITGPGGTLSINNTAASVQIRMGFGSSLVGPLAVLDMSGLGTFNGNLNHIQLGVESGAPRQVAGVWYLARTNNITLVQGDNVNGNLTSGSPALYLGHNTHSGNTNGSALYLGISNNLYLNFAVIGRGNQTNNLVAFNPLFITNQPSVRLRASDGTGRVGIWTVGDNSAGGLTGPSSGTNDFSGGSVDGMFDLLFLGRGRVGTTVNTGIGVLTFDRGTVDVNTLRLGTMVDEATSTNASGVGTVNVNGSGILIVNTILEFSHTNTLAAAAPSASAGMRGTLNVNGGSVQASNIRGGGGTGIINLNSGIIDLEGGQLLDVTTVNIGAPGNSQLAALTNAGALGSPNPITIATNGLFAGSASLTAPKLILNGAISPGVGGVGSIVNSGSIVVGPGGFCNVDVQNAAGTPGTSWDFVQNAGGIDVQATPANPFTIQIQSLEAPLQGLLNFDNNVAFSWPIIGGSGVTNFAASKFVVNSGAFPDDLAGGYFYVSASGSSLNLAFTNNHAPNAADATFYYRPGTTLQIPLAALAAHWSDPDGDAVQLAGVNPLSANAIAVTYDSANIYYSANAALPDTITYTVSDIRTNPPATYRPGDTVRTDSAVIQLVPLPTISGIRVTGSMVVLSGSNASAGQKYVVLSSTNIRLPFSSWMRLATNSFDNNGNFTSTNGVSPGPAQQFYLLLLP